MNREPARKTKTPCNPALQESSSSTAPQTTMDGRTKKIKRNAGPEKNTQRKRIKATEMAAPPCRNSDDAGMRRKKRKVREDGEEPSQRTKKRRLDALRRNGKDLTSSNTESSSNPLEGCSTSVEGGRRKCGKRKPAAGGEGPTRKRKRSLDLDQTTEETTEEETEQDLSPDAQRALFQAKYQELNQLGKGGCGSVLAGYRKADKLPVAIKHIPEDKVFCKETDENGRTVSVEVAIMLKLAAETTGSVGTSAPVSLLDWYDLGQELILVLERPVPSEDLLQYTNVNGGSLDEDEAKIILKQLIDAAKELEDLHIFHRDIKMENILIETGSDALRVRLIDFGLSCFFKKRSYYRTFYGTPDHIPPEWYRRNTYSAGPTTVWQMGVLLFDLLHRNTDFKTNMYLKKTLKISRTLSRDCRDFLQMCLTVVPEQRPTLEELQLHPWLR